MLSPSRWMRDGGRPSLLSCFQPAVRPWLVSAAAEVTDKASLSIPPLSTLSPAGSLSLRLLYTGVQGFTPERF